MHFYKSVLDLPVHFLNDVYHKWILELNEKDIAHDENHLMWTAINASTIMESYPRLTPIERKAILIAAYTHDVGNIENREYHHHIGADWVTDYLEDNGDFFEDVPDLDKPLWLLTVHQCIMKHRASFKGTRNTLYEKIVAAADRGVPEIKLYFYRSYIYSRNKFGYNHEEGVIHSWEHIHEKYTPKGYGMKDKLLITMYPKETKKLWDDIYNITEDEYRAMASGWDVKYTEWQNKRA